jgi:hypothetical protein
MFPTDLTPEMFSGYPPEGRKLARDYLGAFQRLPLSFLPNLLREVIDYDFKFPAERKTLEKELANLGTLSPQESKDWFRGFAEIQLSLKLEQFDWINSPSQFVEQLSSHLWTTHQVDAFRKAALEYADRLNAAIRPDPTALPRLGIAVMGQSVDAPEEPLFRKLRPHGAYFSAVQPDQGLEQLLSVVAARAKSTPVPYGHWYIDGGQEAPHSSAITCVSYRSLEPARVALLSRIQAETKRSGAGPESLRTLMARMHPSDLGFDNSGDPVLDRFQVKLLTEGSGTQIFSTSFAQWAARESLRRAQPLTLLVRFAPRQRQKPMNELLSPSHEPAELDPLGSLMDADMAAYYNWLNQQRLPGSEKSLFLAWFENHREAVVISPSMPRGTVSTSALTIPELLSWMA